MWLFLLIMVGPCTVMQVPLEIGRWKLAAAIQAREAGDKERAYAELNAAMNWVADRPSLLAQQAEWHLADGQVEEGLAVADKLLESAPDSSEALRAHSRLLQMAGRFEDAIADLKKVDQNSQRTGVPSRAEALNELAYAQALAEVELDDALKNVDESLELLTKEEKRTGLELAIRDTRGYILFLKGRYAEALVDMNFAVAPLNPSAVAKKQLDFHRLPPKVQRPLLHKFRQEFQSIAVMYYHRGLVFQALGRQPEAAADLQRARSLIGREPDESLF